MRYLFARVSVKPIPLRVQPSLYGNCRKGSRGSCVLSILSRLCIGPNLGPCVGPGGSPHFSDDVNVEGRRPGGNTRLESDSRTLAFLLCAHRSGLSLTASVFQELDMSLGLFPLLGAHSSNIHGHYESLPFYMLKRKVQEIALGFPDDVPMSEEVLTTFLDGKGIWPKGVKIPDELLDEGRRLVAGLVGSTGKALRGDEPIASGSRPGLASAAAVAGPLGRVIADFAGC